MAAQPFQPREPTDYDRLFGRITIYIDARLDAITNQMRLGFAEAYARDDALLKRIENVENMQKIIIDMQREMIGTMQTMQQTMQTMQQTMQTMQQTMQTLQATQQAMQQEMREGFAAQAERHNELMVRVERLERNSNPPTGETEH